MEEAVWQLVVLIPKGVGEYLLIGIMEVVCKVVTVIINLCLRTAISFHDVLHIFRVICSTGTASLKAKLIQQLTDMR